MVQEGATRRRTVCRRHAVPIKALRFMCRSCVGQYSVREAFEGSTVLITGATGNLRIVLLDIFDVDTDQQ